MRRRLIIIVVLAAAGAAGAARTKPLEVDAGSLRARVIADPWQIVFEDATRAQVLREATGSSPALPGAVGFRTATGWVHATRLASTKRRGRGLVAVAVAWRWRLTFATIASGLLALHLFDWLL